MYKFILSVLFLSLIACDSGPKVIEADTPANSGGATTGVASSTSPVTDAVADQHKVVALETLEHERYTYIRVKEGAEEFWIAIPKSQVEIGATYYYSGGLIKKDFYSQEHDRTFETLYLVRGITPASGSGSAVDQALGHNHDAGAVTPPTSVPSVEGAMKLNDLFKNKSKYNGKTVKVTGKVMKVNPMIMGRNWLHIQDGSGENLDLTVTTQEGIPAGHVITLEGVIALDKDFGAGYRYDIILEDAKVVQ
ncbi:MAG: GW dipeptide domain-containing protein [Saprospiraceae bacterium]